MVKIVCCQIKKMVLSLAKKIESVRKVPKQDHLKDHSLVMNDKKTFDSPSNSKSQDNQHSGSHNSNRVKIAPNRSSDESPESSTSKGNEASLIDKVNTKTSRGLDNDHAILSKTKGELKSSGIAVPSKDNSSKVDDESNTSTKVGECESLSDSDQNGEGKILLVTTVNNSICQSKKRLSRWDLKEKNEETPVKKSRWDQIDKSASGKEAKKQEAACEKRMKLKQMIENLSQGCENASPTDQMRFSNLQKKLKELLGDSLVSEKTESCEEYTPKPVLIKDKSGGKSSSKEALDYLFESDVNFSTKKEYTSSKSNFTSYKKESAEKEYEPTTSVKSVTKVEYEPSSITKLRTDAEYNPTSSSKFKPKLNRSPIQGKSKSSLKNSKTYSNSPDKTKYNKTKSESLIKKCLGDLDGDLDVHVASSGGATADDDEYCPLPFKLDKPCPEYIPSEISDTKSNKTFVDPKNHEEYVPLPANSLCYGGSCSTNSAPLLEKYSLSQENSLPIAHTGGSITPGFYRERENNDSAQGDGDSRKAEKEKSNKKNPESYKGSGNNKQKIKTQNTSSESSKSIVLVYCPPPPSNDDIMNSLSDYNIPDVIHACAFYSNKIDIPAKPMEIGGQILKLKSKEVSDLENFEGRHQDNGIYNWRLLLNTMNVDSDECTLSNTSVNTKNNKENSKCVMTPVKLPPTPAEVGKWAAARKIMKSMRSDKGNGDDDDEDGSHKSEKKGDSTSRNLQSGPLPHTGNSSGSSGLMKVTKSHTPHQSRDNMSTTEILTSKSISGLRHTSTPQPQKSSHIQPIHLTPIAGDSVSGFERTPSPALISKRKPKRRVSWEEAESSTSNLSQLKKRRVSQESLPPLVEQDPEVSEPVKCLKMRVSFSDTAKSRDKNVNMATTDASEAQEISDDDKTQELIPMPDSPEPFEVTGKERREDSDATLIADSVDREIESSPEISSSQPRKVELTSSLSTKSCSQQSQDSSLRRQLMDTQFRQQFRSLSQAASGSSQGIDGPTLNNTFGFKFSNHNLREAKALHEHEYLTTMCIECHVSTRPHLLPDPLYDPISSVIFSIIQDVPDDHPSPQKLKGAIVVSSSSGDLISHSGISGLYVLHVDDEKALLNEIVNLATTWDPDMLVGYEVQMSSWGYLLERGTSLGLEIVGRLSRVPEGKDSHYKEEFDEYGADHTSQIHITGRIVLNVWRLMRVEVSLKSYTLENVAYHILHTRIPSFSHDDLRAWWTHDATRWRTLEHYSTRCNVTIDLLHRLDLIHRTAELARLFGIQFYDVLARGSQYRVESMMLRLSRGANMVAVSPSIQQRSAMKSPEWFALTLEPKSRFYSDPVVVLDFQSLYPSMMIAYNYCYSTCLGRVDQINGSNPFEFGTTHLRIQPDELLKFADQINVSPCGVAFAPSSVRRGILPQMLEEILNTRIMVKRMMKKYKDDTSLQRVLHSRQLGLKLIANVTYGYTSANFSGRMPCAEIGDSVVSKGRETLERCIKLVNHHPTWNAEVVYGDTDSLFVHLPGRSKDQAFTIGYEIADQVTQMYPKPIKLKFEKVYLPCILQTKKRYVGYMYESPTQEDPEFDAKGIETVRRDGCTAVVKILEKSLRILFETKDVSKVKEYVQRQFVKLYQGRVSLQDLTFAKEYRGASGYKPGACVPALELARKWTRKDPRKEPRVGERVPYVVVYGAPGLPLIQLVRSPDVILADPALRINATYYITRAIMPPLERCFSLLGVDIANWYNDLPRWSPNTTASLVTELATNQKKSNNWGSVSSGGMSIARYFTPSACIICGAATVITGAGPGVAMCSKCKNTPQDTVLALNEKIRSYERAIDDINKVCQACLGCKLEKIECISIDCPITYQRNQASRDNLLTGQLQELVKGFGNFTL